MANNNIFSLPKLGKFLNNRSEAIEGLNFKPLLIGDPAPQFSKNALVGEEFRNIALSDFFGKWVVLFFWPRDFTFVCPTEIKDFNAHLENFKQLNAVIVGASCDSTYVHRAWVKADLGQINFPLLADENHFLARAYNVLLEKEGIALRGTFIIDPDGILKYSVVSDLNVGRSVKETLRVLSALQTGELCPASWEQGQQTLGQA